MQLLAASESIAGNTTASISCGNMSTVCRKIALQEAARPKMPSQKSVLKGFWKNLRTNSFRCKNCKCK